MKITQKWKTTGKYNTNTVSSMCTPVHGKRKIRQTKTSYYPKEKYFCALKKEYDTPTV